LISYFPKPYPDEILYSLVARFNYHLSAKGPKENKFLLFGERNITSTIDLQSGLSWFTKELSAFWETSEEEIINNYTLFPLYAPFLPETANEKIIASMLGQSGDIHTRAGLNAGIFPSLQTPRFCPICFVEDAHESYFRRSHQIPSIPICIKHNCFLHEVNLDHDTINRHFFIPPIRKYCTPNGPIIFNESEHLVLLAKRIISILDGTRIDYDFDGTPFYYNNRIKEIGFGKGLGSINWEKLYNEFSSFYQSEMLELLRSQVKLSNSTCWLKSIFRKHRKSFDPIRHALVHVFISGLNNSNITENINIELWPCKNPICKHFGENVISNPQKHYDSKAKKSIVYLECSCGYGYTLSTLAKSGQQFTRVKNYGEEWMNKLKELLASGISIRKVASKLGCDSKTVNLLASQTTQTQSKVPLVDRSKEWIMLKDANPSSSITELRKMDLGLYASLYRKNKDWLINQDYGKKESTSTFKRIDWVQRDRDLLPILQATYQKLRFTDPMKRISKTLLFALSGNQGVFEKHINKLPKCSSYLDKIVESKEKHRMKRLIHARQILIDNNVSLTKSNLIRASGLRKEYISPRIDLLIKKLINNEPIKLTKRHSA